MGEKFTSRVGYLIRNFRIASDMTQKELADKCGLNESTIRNYELGNRYPDEATLLNIAYNQLTTQFVQTLAIQLKHKYVSEIIYGQDFIRKLLYTLIQMKVKIL